MIVDKLSSMSYKFVVGIDVSKATVDVAVLSILQPELIHHDKFANDADGVNNLFDWLKNIPDFYEHQTIFCMEATGLYCHTLTEKLQQKELPIWIENSVQIKRSMGILRGKNDKTDAVRIAKYAARNIDRIRLWKPMREVVEKIKHLATLRERLVQTQKKLLTPIEELRVTGRSEMAHLLEKSISKSIHAIEKDLQKIEMEILSLISKDESLRKLYLLITSVVGIGFVTAVNLIIHTNEFTSLKDSRKLACYCGVAPFPYQSGTSIKGRTRVHAMANKKLKTNLHMASLTAVRLDYDLRMYYERKIAEGKNKLSILNAVKCKMLARVVAVVNKQSPYVKKIV
jgi:transposase